MVFCLLHPSRPKLSEQNVLESERKTQLSIVKRASFLTSTSRPQWGANLTAWISYGQWWKRPELVRTAARKTQLPRRNGKVRVFARFSHSAMFGFIPRCRCLLSAIESCSEKFVLAVLKRLRQKRRNFKNIVVLPILLWSDTDFCVVATLNVSILKDSRLVTLVRCLRWFFLPSCLYQGGGVAKVDSSLSYRKWCI